MSVNVSPFGPCPQFELSTGVPAVGYKLFFYVAGSTTKQDTYTDSTGLVANTNPLILNALGMPDTEIWLTAGQAYKVVYTSSTDTDPPASPIRTWDNLSGINDTVVTIDQWVASGLTPTYVSATQFTVTGDQTSAFHVGRRLKTTNTSGTIYSRITASAYTTLTTITVVNDSGSLDSGLSAVSYGLITSSNSSLPAIISPNKITMSGSIIEAEGAAVASASSCNIWANDGNTVHITGTTTINDFATAPQAGAWKKVIFDGALTLTQSANLNLNGGGSNITTDAGAMAHVYADTTTQMDVFVTLKSGAAVVSTTFSSSAENIAGTVENKAVDPLGIREAFNCTGTAPVYACRAWVNFNGTGTVAIRGSGNVSSITDNGTGDYTVNFTTALPDANYGWSVGGGIDAATLANGDVTAPANAAPTTSAFRMATVNTTGGATDFAYVSASFFR